MAVPIEVTTIDPLQFVTVSSRYANSTVIYWSELKKLTFEIYVRTPIALTQQDKYFVVETEYRPDLVSLAAYGTVDFWWKIMEANNIFDIFDFKAGLNIRIPNAVFG